MRAVMKESQLQQGQPFKLRVRYRIVPAGLVRHLPNMCEAEGDEFYQAGRLETPEHPRSNSGGDRSKGGSN